MPLTCDPTTTGAGEGTVQRLRQPLAPGRGAAEQRPHRVHQRGHAVEDGGRRAEDAVGVEGVEDGGRVFVGAADDDVTAADRRRHHAQAPVLELARLRADVDGDDIGPAQDFSGKDLGLRSATSYHGFAGGDVEEGEQSARLNQAALIHHGGPS